MIKRISLSLFFIFTVCTSLLKAQTGREWIVSGQPYYKIPVVQEAVYAIPFTQLNSAGISTIDPAKLQIWFRGVEQSIYINNSNDSLFFYGHGNDGALDSLIYEPMNARTNKFYSLFSDTTYYFLTVAAVNGKRLNANAAVPGIVQSNQRHTEIVSYSEDYQAGQLYSSDTHLTPGDIGEGWMSNSISQSGATPKDYTINVPVSNLYSGGADPQLEILLIGTNNNTHNIDIVIGNPSSPSQVYSIPYFYARSVYRFTQTFPLSSMTNNQPLKVTVRVKGNTVDPDLVAVAYLTLNYPQTTDVTGKSFYTLQPLADNNAKTLSFSGFTNTSFLWDVSTEGAFVNLNYNYIGSGSASADLLSSASKVLYVNSFNPVIGIQQVDMTPYPVTSAEMLLITHTKLLSGTGIDNFVAHRSSPAGGSISIAVTDVNKLYNLYTYGEKHCMAIKRYCQEQIDGGSPKYLFLVGKGINYDYFGTTDNGDYFYRKNPVGFINNHHTYQQLDYRMEDLIPPYGWPASDLYYTITDLTLRPKLATGRLSARTDADVNQYVDKLMANDTLSSNVIWRKNLVHLSGGKTSDEVQSFQAVVNGFKSIVEGPLFGGKVVRSYAKNLSSGAVDTKLIYSIADEVNKGISYLTFFGHSSPSIIDLDIGNVSNPVYGYNNVGKYPVLIQDGCQSAEFFIQGCIPEDWIMTPKKGALLTFGHGDIGYPTYMQTYTNNFYKLNFADSRYINASMGEVHKKTIDTFLTIYASDYNPAIVKAQATQYVLQGDPTVKMYKPQLTDYAIAGDAEAGEKKVFISAYSNTPISATVDSFAVAIPITNYGLSSSKNLQIQVKHTVINNNVTVIDETFPIKTVGPIGYVDTIYFTIRANNPKLLGINKFTITVDPFDSIPEFNEHNNVATLQYYLPLSSVSCLYPLEYSVVHDQPVSFVAQSIDLFEAQTNYYVEIDTSHLYNSPAKIIKTI
ncbi:MAG: hypothetical protein JWO58_2595, partial [Chitinophagaceae bacterium]|nr:hypothetical protein [Chitinophagaceae bacterium]